MASFGQFGAEASPVTQHRAPNVADDQNPDDGWGTKAALPPRGWSLRTLLRARPLGTRLRPKTRDGDILTYTLTDADGSTGGRLGIL